jgi:hypothetical protein
MIPKSCVLTASRKTSLHVFGSTKESEMISALTSIQNIPSGLTCGLNRKHFPPFAARTESGSGRMFVNLSSCRSSFVFLSCVLCCDIFLIFNIRAADMGIVLENSARSRVEAAAAAPDRTMGGRKRDIASKEDIKLSF